MSSKGPTNNTSPPQGIHLIDPDTNHTEHTHTVIDCDKHDLKDLQRDPFIASAPLRRIFRCCPDLNPDYAEVENWLKIYVPWKLEIDAILTQCKDEDGGDLARFRRISASILGFIILM